jgi:iron complex outermembrane receptor protein
MSLSSVFRSSALLLCAASLSPAQTVPPAPPRAAGPAAGHDHVEHLDQFVVSAGHDAKTMFDLAQGTSVLAGEELHRRVQSTLGETLAAVPGVASTAYGPGSSRPIIRGLGGDRVRVLDNGIGALDASSISPDHNTALEPLFASRIEVLRGPSTLLYGSSAIGGAINVIDSAIPATAPDGRARGALELRAGGAARERTAVVAVGGGAQAFSAQVNALSTRTRDLDIPGVARIDADAPARQTAGRLPDSATETFSVSVGGGLFWKAGRAGGSVGHYETEYGVPNGEEIGIRMRRTRFDLEGEVTQPFAFFRGASVRLGVSDYTHSEIDLHGPEVHTTYTNDAWEGRLELPHVAIGALTGTLGLQAARSDLAAVGEEVVAPPSLTQSLAIFALEEVKLSPALSLQFGGRLEGQSVKLGEVDPDLPPVRGYSARSGQKKKFSGASASLGLVFYPAKDWSLAASLAHSERLPTAQELFSHGPHAGTGAYEVGTSRLGRERSLGFDLSLRRRAGFVTGAIGGFVNRFDDFIYESELPAAAIPAEFNEEGLTPYQFVATGARFVGGEAEVLFHLIENQHHRLHLELTADRVRARETSTDTPLPRIPPVRYGARLSFEDGRWHAVAEVRHAAKQTRTAATESATDSYTLVNASVSYLIPAGRATYELFLRARNLTDEEARDHTSFLKEFAPQPGRGVLAGVRLTF